MRGDELGPLHGVPIPIKDTEAVAGMPHTIGSLLYKDRNRRRRFTACRTDKGRWRNRGGKDEPAGVRARRIHRKPAWPAMLQPMEPGPHARRIERRIGGRRGRLEYFPSGTAATAAVPYASRRHSAASTG